MHEPAVELQRVSWRPRLPLAAKVASARLDVLLFTGATAILAAHAAVDSFIAPEPGTAPSDHLLRGLATFSVLALASGRLSAAARGWAGGARGGAWRPRAGGSGSRDCRRPRRGRPRRGLDGFLLLPVGAALLALSAALALALAQARSAPLPAASGDRGRSGASDVLARRSGRDRRSSRRTARARTSRPPTSGARTRR